MHDADRKPGGSGLETFSARGDTMGDRTRDASFPRAIGSLRAAVWLGIAVALTAAGPEAAVSQAPSRGAFGVVLFEESRMVPMRDGVRLATDVYRPTRDGRPVEEPLPVLLHRTPYDKSSPGGREVVEYFVSHGYVVVVQDTRGRYASEGVFSKYYDYDAYDGYDTIEWIPGLPYAEAYVGMWGTSYGGHTQADAAKLAPPALRTIVVNEGGMSNPWDHSVRFNGAFEVGRQLTWAWEQLRSETADPVIRELLEREDVYEWMAEALPLRRGLNPLSVDPEFEDYYFEQATRGAYDDYWKSLGKNWEERYEQTADIPMIHVGGWYDIYGKGTVDNFVGLSAFKSSEIRLVMGPWIHGSSAPERPWAGEVDFGPDGAIPDFATTFHRRWYDHVLKGEENGVEDEPRVRLFVMGTGDGSRTPEGRLAHGGYWRTGQEWPLEETRLIPFYFRGDGRLSRDPPGPAEGSTTYTFDPEDPVPTIGGGVSGRLNDGAFDQRERPDLFGAEPPYLPLKARSDVVVFQTPPLGEAVEVVGPIRVTLHVSSTAPDTDFTVKLLDVHPPSEDFPTGFDLNLTDGIIRARYRESPERPGLMTPGEVYEITFDLFPTANRFKAGHRIRVDVSSSNFPRFDVNPNTGEAIGEHRRTVKADNTIHHSSEHASHVVLPLVPAPR